MKVKNRKIMMAILLAGAFVALLAETFLNNGLITIMHSFNVNQSTVQWLSTGYLLIVGVMIPISAWVFNRFTTRFSYLSMLIIFIVGSIICIFATNFYVLLLGRMIEAVAAGAMMPFIQNVILSLFDPNQRGLALGITGLVVAFGPAIGPTVSGLILKFFDWQMLFIVLTVTSTLVFICAVFNFPTVNQPKTIKLDWVSFFESIFGFGIILFVFSEIGNNGQINLKQIIAFFIGVIILFLFSKRQLKLPNPLLNLHVFKVKQFNVDTILSTLSNISMVGVELVLPMYLQTTRKETALVAGLVMMPGAIIMGVFNPISGSLYDKFGIKRISIIGFFILLLGTIPMIFFNPNTSIWLITVSYTFRMVGIALTMMTTFTDGINALSGDNIAYGNAAASTVRQIGGSLGTAISMMLVSLGTIISSNKGISVNLKSEVGYHLAFYLMIFIAILGIVVSFFISEKKQK